MSNPYTLNPVTTSDYFVASRGGRGAQAQRLLQNIQRVNPAPNHISIIGERRFGKTSLLKYLRQAASGNPNLFTVDLNMLGLSSQNPEGFYRKLTRTLIRETALSKDSSVLDYEKFEDFLYDLSHAGQRLVLLIDEFDLIARLPQFDLAFFNNLRYLADNPDLPLTLVVASVMPLKEIAHKEVYGSPFFNIFYTQRLGLLSQKEAETLVSHPPGGESGFPDLSAEIIALVGRHPYFLQLACSLAWDLREAAGGKLDMAKLGVAFTQKAHDHYQYIWDHSSSDEQKTLSAIVNGEQTSDVALDSLTKRGYVVNDKGVSLGCGQGLADFVRAKYIVQTFAQPIATPAPRVPLLKPMRVNNTAQTRRLALIVGVNKYQHRNIFRRLRCAERDAEEMTKLLKQLKFEIKQLLGSQATYATIKAAFTEFNQVTAVEPHSDSCFVFYFSGHGLMDPNNDESAYLALHNTNLSDLATTGIEMSKLVYNLLPLVRVPHSLALLDSCHAGFAAGVKDGGVQHSSARLSNIVGQLWAGLRGRMVLAACAGDAQTRENFRLRHGILTYYLLRHWRDLDGFHPPDRITFTSLMNYVGHQIRQNHPDLSPPTWSGAGAGPAFILRHIT